MYTVKCTVKYDIFKHLPGFQKSIVVLN